MRRGLVLLILLLCSCSPGLSRPTVTPSPSIEAEEYAVYSALLRQNPIGYNFGSPLVIREQTFSDASMFETALENARRLPSGLVNSYRSRNGASYTLDPNLDVGQDYVMISQEESDKIRRQGGETWLDFEAKYPGAGGMLSFSRIGFNTNEDEALALMGFLCGDLCGAGGLYLLVKEDGDWKVKEFLMVWQS